MLASDTINTPTQTRAPIRRATDWKQKRRRYSAPSFVHGLTDIAPTRREYFRQPNRRVRDESGHEFGDDSLGGASSSPSSSSRSLSDSLIPGFCFPGRFSPGLPLSGLSARLCSPGSSTLPVSIRVAPPTAGGIAGRKTSFHAFVDILFGPVIRRTLLLILGWHVSLLVDE